MIKLWTLFLWTFIRINNVKSWSESELTRQNKGLQTSGKLPQFVDSRSWYIRPFITRKCCRGMRVTIVTLDLHIKVFWKPRVILRASCKAWTQEIFWPILAGGFYFMDSKILDVFLFPEFNISALISNLKKFICKRYYWVM